MNIDKFAETNPGINYEYCLCILAAPMGLNYNKNEGTKLERHGWKLDMQARLDEVKVLFANDGQKLREYYNDPEHYCMQTNLDSCIESASWLLQYIEKYTI